IYILRFKSSLSYFFIYTVSSLSSSFKRPLLIYGDQCYSCAKFAKVISILSRGWIRTASHYYSPVAMEAKEMIFPADYDATKMFWPVNKSGAHGARSGLLPLIKEIILSFFSEEGERLAILVPHANLAILTTVYPAISSWI
ncbi:MAG: hypothetical protein M3261_07025, partial [Thermoproteota archaeon]|nr:hypothetical protein [Thermoproteota archaeon]